MQTQGERPVTTLKERHIEFSRTHRARTNFMDARNLRPA